MRASRRRFTLATASAAAITAAPAIVRAQSKVIRVAYIDPFSGLMAPVGANGFKQFQAVADLVNSKKLAGDYKIEMVSFDNKLSPQESLSVLKQAIDRGIRFVTQGNGSGVALALQDAIEKHNERNPKDQVLFFNYAAVDPDMTNSKCSFWHFRFDANSDMKMEAMTTFMKGRPEIKNVYLLNQNYAFGHQVQRAAEELLPRKRPDIKIVGKDLHPLAQVKDFAPYIAKIRAAGADTVITGNWGNDLTLLVKAAKDANLNVNFYTYYAGVIGTPAAMGAAAEGKVFATSYWSTNVKNAALQLYLDFKKKHNEEFYTVSTWNILHMLAQAVKQTGGAEPLQIARALEGMKMQGPLGEIEMRRTDHQLQQPLFVSVWQKRDGKAVKYDVENTGYGWADLVQLEPYVAAQPTSCNMKRPA
ncbi:MAG: branched-chain amino acid ABC transporter substrate-binding protein [Burkholderiales bacterium]|nr:branched-chain amino acid ABC transporter substrate-binding protein [Burkholderiales bacterium]